MSNILEVKERLSRVEEHQRLLVKAQKEDTFAIMSTIKDIKHALMGNELNGYQGMVSDLEAIREDIRLSNKRITDLEDNKNRNAWVSNLVTAVVTGSFVALATLGLKK